MIHISFEAEISKAQAECINLGAKCSGVTTESSNPPKYTCRANEPILDSQNSTSWLKAPKG